MEQKEAKWSEMGAKKSKVEWNRVKWSEME